MDPRPYARLCVCVWGGVGGEGFSHFTQANM